MDLPQHHVYLILDGTLTHCRQDNPVVILDDIDDQLFFLNDISCIKNPILLGSLVKNVLDGVIVPCVKYLQSLDTRIQVGLLDLIQG